MKRHVLAATLLLLPLAGFGQTPPSKVPSNLSFQGRVADGNGKLIGTAADGTSAPVNRRIIFRIYDDPTKSAAANVLWSEEQVVTIAGGDFNVLLGSGSGNIGNAFNGAVRYLGITVDDGDPATPDTEISPRQQMVTGAFAFRARVAETVDDGAITSAMIANNAVTTQQLAPGAVTAAKFSSDVGLWSASGNNSYRSTGNVGIGTTTPTARLQVGNRPGLPAAFNVDAVTGAMFKSLNDNGGATLLPPEPALILAREGVAGQSWPNIVRFDLGRTSAGTASPVTRLDIKLNHGDPNTEGNNTPTIMTLLSGGNVGIGTTTPAAVFDVRGNVRFGANAFTKSTNGTGEIALDNGSADTPGIHFYDGNNSNWGIDSFSGSLRFVKNLGETAATVAMTATATGNVGIGTTAPARALDVTSSSWNSMVVRGAGGTDAVVVGNLGGLATIGAHTGALANWTTLALNPGGNVSIGGSPGSERLDVNGAIAVRSADGVIWRIKAEASGDGRLSFYSGADATNPRATLAFGTGALVTASDARLKKDIATVERALDSVLALRPVSYRFKALADDSPKTLGFIAQEMEPVLPEAVSEMNGMKGIAYSVVIPVAVGAIQELAAENGALKQRVREMETKIAAMDEWRTSLEKRFAALGDGKTAITGSNSQ